MTDPRLMTGFNGLSRYAKSGLLLGGVLGAAQITVAALQLTSALWGSRTLHLEVVLIAEPFGAFVGLETARSLVGATRGCISLTSWIQAVALGILPSLFGLGFFAMGSPKLGAWFLLIYVVASWALHFVVFRESAKPRR